MRQENLYSGKIAQGITNRSDRFRLRKDDKYAGDWKQRSLVPFSRSRALESLNKHLDLKINWIW